MNLKHLPDLTGLPEMDLDEEKMIKLDKLSSKWRKIYKRFKEDVTDLIEEAGGAEVLRIELINKLESFNYRAFRLNIDTTKL